MNFGARDAFFGIALRRDNKQGIARRQNGVESIAVYQMQEKISARFQPIETILEKRVFAFQIINGEIKTKKMRKGAHRKQIRLLHVAHDESSCVHFRIILLRLRDHGGRNVEASDFHFFLVRVAFSAFVVFLQHCVQKPDMVSRATSDIQNRNGFLCRRLLRQTWNAFDHVGKFKRIFHGIHHQLVIDMHVKLVVDIQGMAFDG